MSKCKLSGPSQKLEAARAAGGITGKSFLQGNHSLPENWGKCRTGPASSPQASNDDRIKACRSPSISSYSAQCGGFLCPGKPSGPVHPGRGTRGLGGWHWQRPSFTGERLLHKY